VYWSRAGVYHIFMYDEDILEYENINDVYLSNEVVTAMVVLDENMYFGSKRTWTRLRGQDPDTWTWEQTSAKKGPQNWQAIVITMWGAVFIGNDGKFWKFNGFESTPFLQHFVFDTAPGSDACMVFDGQRLRLFWNDTTQTRLTTPTITPNGGNFSGSSVSVALSGDAGVTIYYTVDGSVPTQGAGTLYATALAVTDGQTVKAVAYKTDSIMSLVASATFTEV